ncbi:MAG: hypothetical protein PVJ38_01325 [Candidatus Bathyarchaeota archaeon]|jgi:hypothetical protein
MPFTPLHLGPALLLGLVFTRHLDTLTLLVASVVVDIEPFMVLVLGFNRVAGFRLPVHGFLHSFLGGSIVALLTGVAMLKTVGLMEPLADSLAMERNLGRGTVIFSAFTGVYLHILLDSTLYSDIAPFWPLAVNPLLGKTLAGINAYNFCFITGLAGLALYLRRFLSTRQG